MRKKLRIIGLIIVFITLINIQIFAVEDKTNETDATNTSINNISENTNQSKTKSSNAYLKTLGITPKEYDFSGFNKDKTSYSVTVPNSVDSVKVVYKTANSKSTVKVTGNTGLEVGTNKIKVIVTAEDGKTTKTYTIKVAKLATEDEKPGNLIDESVASNMDLYLTSLEIEGANLEPEFSSGIYSYEINIDMNKNDMSNAKVKAVANKEKAVIEVNGNSNLVEGENLINIIVKLNGYSQTVYQVTVNKVNSESEIVSSDNVINTAKNNKTVLITVIAAIIIIVLACIIIIKNKMRNIGEEEIDDDIEDDDVKLYNFDKEYENRDNFIEELYKKRNSGERLEQYEEDTIEDIEKENDRIFNKVTQGSTVEYSEEMQDDKEDYKLKEEDFIEKRINKRRKGKHF